MNTSKENVDVFTVLVSPTNKSLIDVRFSAHGSPYYLPENLNAKVSDHQNELESSLGGRFVMISISECLLEPVCPERSSCNNQLNIKDSPAVVYTNQTSFVGVNAVVEVVCDCLTPVEPILPPAVGCESMGVTFTGNGWALYPSFEACNSSNIRLEILPQNLDGLVFYVGPMDIRPQPIVRGE